MNIFEQIEQNLTSNKSFLGQISLDEPMAQKTTFKIGGIAKLYICPQNYYSFQLALEEILRSKQNFFILGGGSNIVFTDGIYDGIILSTKLFSDIQDFPPQDFSPDFGKIQIQKNQVLVTCFAGTPVSALVNYCTEHNYSGMEQFAGLPGSVGGALYMNARCFDKSISDILFATCHVQIKDGKMLQFSKLMHQEEWDYKKSPFQDGLNFITSATFLFTRKPNSYHTQIEVDCKKYIQERIQKGHFIYPSAGSVFKNNHEFGKPSGKIIDEAGLKGLQIGGAAVPDFHGNFIVNKNHATSDDVKSLVQQIQQKVQQKFGFLLQPEIIFVD